MGKLGLQPISEPRHPARIGTTSRLSVSNLEPATSHHTRLYAHVVSVAASLGRADSVGPLKVANAVFIRERLLRLRKPGFCRVCAVSELTRCETLLPTTGTGGKLRRGACSPLILQPIQVVKPRYNHPCVKQDLNTQVRFVVVTSDCHFRMVEHQGAWMN